MDVSATKTSLLNALTARAASRATEQYALALPSHPASGDEHFLISKCETLPRFFFSLLTAISTSRAAYFTLYPL